MYPSSLTEQLTDNFYRWEKRGRGWQVWSYPVDLEPPFAPFYHAVPQPTVIDDGRKPGFFERLWGQVNGQASVSDVIHTKVPDDNSHSYEILPEKAPENYDLTHITITTPPHHKLDLEQTEHFLINLGACAWPISFEIVGDHGAVYIQVAIRTSDAPLFRSQLKAHFPEFTCLEDTDRLLHAMHDSPMVFIDFGLSDEFMRPLRMMHDRDPDSHIGLIAALEYLSPGEMGAVQVMFSPVRYPWRENVMRSVTDWDGKPFFADAPDALPLAREKVEHPLFSTVLRVMGCGADTDRAWDIVTTIASSLAQLADPASNQLVPLDDEGYTAENHFLDILDRTTHRSGMLLNSRELISLVHLPSQAVSSEKLSRVIKKTKALPQNAQGHPFILGENVHQGRSQTVSLDTEQRMRHTYIIGATGTGKSTLLHNMINQDIEQGNGVAVFDPHGDLIDRIVGHIPPERAEDVILLDPSDPDYPLGLNILSARSEIEKNVISSDLISVFRRLSTSWGDQMTTVFGNAVLAFLESDQGGTLVDLRRFLVEKEFRAAYLKTVTDPEIIYYWQKEFPLLTGKPHASILTRLDTFLRPKILRRMVRQKDGIHFEDILGSRKILLAKLSQGLIGEENAYLLGTLMVSKLHQAAMARQAHDPSDRPPFYCYIDEFQNFITPSMTAILSGARKYHLGLILAHQDLRQIWSRDTEVASSVISNPGTRICFRLGDFDAQKLSDGFSAFDAQHLQNLGIGEAICRIERPEYDFTLNVFPPASIPDDVAARLQRFKERSFEKYGCVVDEEAVIETATEPILTPKNVAKDRPKPEAFIQPRPQNIPPTESIPEYEKTDVPEPKQEGKGGPQHRYLQSLIKRMAEEYGFRVTLEQQTPDGQGQVDVSLESDDRRIAIEISVTTGSDHEVQNIEKCLKADYDTVILCSADESILKQVEKKVLEIYSEADQTKIKYLIPDNLMSFFEGEKQPGSEEEKRVKGYKVKVKLSPVDGREKEVKKDAIAQVMRQTMRRLRI